MRRRRNFATAVSLSPLPHPPYLSTPTHLTYLTYPTHLTYLTYLTHLTYLISHSCTFQKIPVLVGLPVKCCSDAGTASSLVML